MHLVLKQLMLVDKYCVLWYALNLSSINAAELKTTSRLKSNRRIALILSGFKQFVKRSESWIQPESWVRCLFAQWIHCFGRFGSFFSSSCFLKLNNRGQDVFFGQYSPRPCRVAAARAVAVTVSEVRLSFMLVATRPRLSPRSALRPYATVTAVAASDGPGAT
jgi:hypothetical protein